MKILFINPTSNNYREHSITKIFRAIPFTFAQLIAITPNCHQIDVVDEVFWGKVNFDKKYDLVAISFFTPHSLHAYEIADEYRKKNVPVVLGGYHASALPEEAKQHADAVVIGEAEITWPQLLKDFENGRLKPFYKQEEPVDPRLIPTPYRGSISGYHPVWDVQATRGCPHGCEFCSVQNVEGRHLRKRPLEDVIQEIKSLKSSHFTFYDSSLTIDPEYTKSLFREMKGLGKTFGCHGNINILNEDEELVKLSKEAGCFNWGIGFESISQDSLDGVSKRNLVENYEIGIKKIKKHGVGVNGLFIFGFDADTIDSFHNTLKAIREWKLDIAHFSILTPFPGTPIFNRFDKEGRILTRDWSRYTCGNVVFEPKNMSTNELFDKTKEITKKFYSFSSIMQRTIENDNLNYSRFVHKLEDNLMTRSFTRRRYRFRY